MEKQYKPIPRFNDHGATCKGHGNYMLDCEMTTREERDLMIAVIDNYSPKNETNTIKKES